MGVLSLINALHSLPSESEQMEPSPPLSPFQSNASLHERTNHTNHINTTSRNGKEDGQAKGIAANLRRKQSSKQLSDRLNSSASSNPPGYIYNAEIASENTSPLMAPNNGNEAELSPPLLETTALSTASLSILSPVQLSPPHSGWPPTRLGPIIERSTRSRLHSSNSRPKLRSSPERRSHIIKPMLSVQSIRPTVSNPPVRLVDGKDLSHRFRSFSLNDLDCLPKSDTSRAWPRSPQQHSSSSDEFLRTLRACPVFPLKPTHSPPYRSPTPLGLPSFGTREAEGYRLTPSCPPNRVIALLQRWIGRPYDENDDRLSIMSNPLSAPTSPAAPSSPTSPPINMLKRVLGAARLVETPRQNDNPRSKLPAGIRIASLPGPLAQADDGTWVRGRWISRASSHGVGTRPLEEHPMARTAELHSIDEIVREIDKACQSAAEEDRSRQMRATQTALDNTAETSHHTWLPVSPLPEPGRPLRTRGTAVGSGRYGSFLEDNSQVSQTPFTPYLRDGVSMSNDSLHSPSNTNEGLPALNVVQQLAIRQDGVTGTHESIEYGEREHARQNIARCKENHHCSKDCWAGFWSFCYCRTGSTDDQIRA